MNTNIARLIIFLFYLASANAFAQEKSDQVLAQLLKTLTQRADGNEGINSKEATGTVKDAYEKLRKASSGFDNYSYMAAAGLEVGEYYMSIHLPDDALRITNENTEYESLTVNKKHEVITEIRILEAEAYREKNDYQNGLSKYLQALNISEKQNLPERKAVILNNIAVLYIGMYDPGNLPNTQKGLYYAGQAVEALKKVETNPKSKSSSLGVAYLNYADLLNSYGTDSGKRSYQIKAIEVFREALMLLTKAGDKATQCQVHANMAYVYKNLGDRYNYYSHLLKAYELLQQQKGGMSMYVQEGVHFALGEYYNDSGDYSRALFHLKEAEKLLGEDVAKDYQMMNLIKNLGHQVYKGMGDYRQAYEYQNDYWKLKDSLLNAETLQKFEEMEVQYQSERKGQQLIQAALELENAHLTRNAVIVVAALLAVSLFFFYRFYTSKNKALRFKKEAADLALKNAGLELQANKEMLDRYTQSLVEKAHLIDNLEKQIIASGRVDDAALSKLSSSRILTRDDWAEYKRLFDKVHPGFFLKVRQIYPDITDADERILAFSKLNINLKEAADILGISYDSMKNSRYRLRKKMGMDSDTDFRDITAAL